MKRDFFGLISIMLLLPSRILTNFVFLGYSSQLYIPGQHYSILSIDYNIDPIEDKRFYIDITFALDQVTSEGQTNSIFDVFTCNKEQTPACVDCYQQNYAYLNSQYLKNQPCTETCKNPELTSFKNYTLRTSFNMSLTNISRSNNQTFIIDNTFFPCQKGGYQPELYLQQYINISIQENNLYGATIKITFILLLQIMMTVIAYLFIMLRKYRKLNKKLEYMKGQEEAQDLLNSFLVNSTK